MSSERYGQCGLFVGKMVLFAAAGGSYRTAANSDLQVLTIVFYALCQLLLNLGEYNCSILKFMFENP